MNKSELVDSVASDAGVEKKQAESVLSAFFDRVTTETKKGGKVSWPGFGSFSTSRRAARKGRNPQTGESVRIKASNVMKFSPSSTLKDALNNRGGAKKSAAKKSAPAKSAAKKSTATKSAAKKSTAKKSTATKSAGSRSSAAKKAPAKKAPAKKATARKASAQKR